MQVMGPANHKTFLVLIKKDCGDNFDESSKLGSVSCLQNGYIFCNTAVLYSPHPRRVIIRQILYSGVCHEQPPLRREESGLLRRVAAYRKFICIGNAILGNGQAGFYMRLAAHKEWLLIAGYTDNVI